MSKKIFYSFFILFLISNYIFAISLRTSTNIPVLYVQVFHNGKWSGWSDHAEVSRGDKLWFHIHSYANGGDIKNLKSSLDNISNHEFKKNKLYIVNASVDADNAEKLTGSVSLSFKDNLKISYASYKWATKLKGSNPEEDEHVKEVPFGQDGREVLTNTGVKLGDLAEDHRSNYLLFFYTESYRPAEAGVCGENKNSCLKGNFIDIKDSTSQYKWGCRGVNGGQSANCQLNKKPENALCSNYVNKCRAGFFTDIKNDNEYYIWKCNGLNGGSSLTCKVKKRPINGICGKSLNRCSRGIFNDVKDTYEKRLWTCKGLYDGKDTSCSIQKMCPCKKEVIVDEFASKNIIKKEDENNCIRLEKENKSLFNKNKKLIDEMSQKNNKNLTISKKTANTFWKEWYWLLVFFYSLMLFLIGVLIGKKRS